MFLFNPLSCVIPAAVAAHHFCDQQPHLSVFGPCPGKQILGGGDHSVSVREPKANQIALRLVRNRRTIQLQYDWKADLFCSSEGSRGIGHEPFLRNRNAELCNQRLGFTLGQRLGTAHRARSVVDPIRSANELDPAQQPVQLRCHSTRLTSRPLMA